MTEFLSPQKENFLRRQEPRRSFISAIIKIHGYILCIYSTLFFQSCIKNSIEPGATHLKWYEAVTVEAKNNPDSTVQVFVDTLPTFCSWKLYRIDSGNSLFLLRWWDQCFFDSCKELNKTIHYRIEFLDDKAAVVKERQVTSVPWSNDVRVGLIYPNSSSKLVEGGRLSIVWNAISFPDTIVRIVTIKNGTQYTFNFCGNSGATMIDFLDFADIGYGQFSLEISDPLNPDYKYVQATRIFHSSSSEIVTKPALKDSVRVGLPAELTWIRGTFEADHVVRVQLFTEHKETNQLIGTFQNSGEAAWIVPNVPPGIFYLRLREDVTNKMYYSMPFYIVN